MRHAHRSVGGLQTGGHILEHTTRLTDLEQSFNGQGARDNNTTELAPQTHGNTPSLHSHHYQYSTNTTELYIIYSSLREYITYKEILVQTTRYNAQRS